MLDTDGLINVMSDGDHTPNYKGMKKGQKKRESGNSFHSLYKQVVQFKYEESLRERWRQFMIDLDEMIKRNDW